MPTLVVLKQGDVVAFRAVPKPVHCVELEVNDEDSGDVAAGERPLIVATLNYDEAIDLCRALLTEVGAPEIAQVLRTMKDGNEEECT